jgi:DNA-binding NarL/FixJ family response regulator
VSSRSYISIAENCPIRAEALPDLPRTAGKARSGPIHVWLADDDDEIRDLLVQLLESERDLDCAAQFGSAVELLSALRCGSVQPDVIVLDNQMPGLRGVDAIVPIRRLAPATAILLLTTFFDVVLQRQALAAGADKFLCKGDDAAELPTHIRQVIASHTGF